MMGENLSPESGPPKYEEVVNLQNNSGEHFREVYVPMCSSKNDTVQVLDGSDTSSDSEIGPDFLKEYLFGMEDSILLEKQIGQQYHGPYSYNIRNAENEALLFQGNVNYKYSADIIDLMGNRRLKIHSTPSWDASIQCFQYNYEQTILGILELRKIEGKICQLKLSNLKESNEYRINIIGNKEIDIIIRRKGILSPIAKIHVPVPSTRNDFNCKIVFQDPLDSRVTITEKFLVMALAVTFLIVRNGKIQAPVEASGRDTGCRYIMTIGIIILAFTLIFLYLYFNSCGYEPYQEKCKPKVSYRYKSVG